MGLLQEDKVPNPGAASNKAEGMKIMGIGFLNDDKNNDLITVNSE